MIGKLSGRVAYVAEDHVLLEAGEVGYIVHCAPRTLAALPRPGGRASLYTDLLVREDLLQLFGFATLVEKEWHRLLTSVQGVGAKVSLAILGALGPEGVSRAIALGDAAAVKRAPGVGPKLATRIVNELKDKAPNVMALGAMAAKAPALGGAASAPEDDDALVDVAPAAPARRKAPKQPDPEHSLAEARAEAEADALSALVNLGYAPHDAASAVARAAQAAEAEPGDKPADAAALIKAALRLLADRL